MNYDFVCWSDIQIKEKKFSVIYIVDSQESNKIQNKEVPNLLTGNKICNI